MNHAPQKSESKARPQSQAATTAQPDTEMELACIDLVCQLEHQLAVAKEEANLGHDL